MYRIPKLYTSLAKYYDRLESQYRDYEHDSQWIAEALLSHRARNVLDVSCGTGNHISKLAASNPELQIYAMDSSKEMIDIARRKAASQHIQYLLADFINLPFAVNSFDSAICMYWSLAGLDEELTLKLFKGLASSLSRDGIFLFDVENAEGIKENLIDAPFIDSFFFTDDEREQGKNSEIKRRKAVIRANYSRKVETDVIDWHAYYLIEEGGVSELSEDRMQLRFYSRSQLERLLSESGFETLRVSSGPFEHYQAYSPSLYFIARKK